MLADALWQWDALVAAAGAHADGVPNAPVTGFSIDSRSIGPGEVFVALQDQRDGHAFVTAAFAKGAAAALVSDSYVRKPGDGALLRVDDPLRGLERIGCAARSRLAPTARVIAVTGSAGKTGTKEMLRACLRAVASAPDRVHAPEKSFNNHWGVPLTLARMPAETEFGVFEIGMNHAGEIRPLVRMVRPHVAIVTNVLPVHVGNFPDGEVGVANAKAEIFEGVEPGGTAIIPRDSAHFPLLQRAAQAQGARLRTFGRDAGADVSASIGSGGAQDSVDAPVARVDAKLVDPSRSARSYAYDLGTPGAHIVVNSLALLAALDSLGCLCDAALRPLSSVRPPPGRGERTKFAAAGILLIDESYNANPRSMQAAIAVLGSVPREGHGRRLAVIGDMLELGDHAAGFHRELKAVLTECEIDLVFACGPNMKILFDSLPVERRGQWAPTSDGLIAPVLAALRAADVVMVKGSLGSRMAPIVDAIKSRFVASQG